MNKKRIEYEEMTTMIKLVGRKDFTVDIICEHLRAKSSCLDEYIKYLCKEEIDKQIAIQWEAYIHAMDILNGYFKKRK